jgi:electron transport complex protein RnfG
MTTMSDASGAAALPPKKGWRDNYLVQGWLMLTLALAFGAVLAAVQLALGPAIAANKRNETFSKVPELVWGRELAAKMAAEDQTLGIETRNLPVTQNGQTTYYRVYDAVWNGQPAGWVIQAAGQGYADRIELLLGLSPDAEQVTGLFILDQKETPGLGNKIAADPWRGQFIGKATAAPLAVVKTTADQPHQIDAITGATISSRAVTEIVNRAVADLKTELAAAAGKAAL